MKKAKNGQRSFSIKKQFQYWFDNRISKGSLGFIRVLIVLSILLAILMGALAVLSDFRETEARFPFSGTALPR